jgi:hypothetical protein
MPLKKCDLCNKEDLTSFVDGRTVLGPWANMCCDCFVEFGTGLGIGRGQLYNWYGQDNVYRQEAGGSMPGKSFP